MNAPSELKIKLTSFSHGGGCGCKIAPGVLGEILKGAKGIVPPQLLVGIETSDDAAVYQINDEQALIATTDFFMPIVDDPVRLRPHCCDQCDLRRLRNGRHADHGARASLRCR